MAIADGDLPGYRYLCLYILFNSPCFLIETIYILKKKSLSLVYYGLISMLATTASIALPVIMGYTIETAIAMLIRNNHLLFCVVIYRSIEKSPKGKNAIAMERVPYAIHTTINPQNIKLTLLIIAAILLIENSRISR